MSNGLPLIFSLLSLVGTAYTLISLRAHDEREKILFNERYYVAFKAYMEEGKLIGHLDQLDKSVTFEQLTLWFPGKIFPVNVDKDDPITFDAQFLVDKINDQKKYLGSNEYGPKAGYFWDVPFLVEGKYIRNNTPINFLSLYRLYYSISPDDCCGTVIFRGIDLVRHVNPTTVGKINGLFGNQNSPYLEKIFDRIAYLSLSKNSKWEEYENIWTSLLTDLKVY